MQQEQSASKKRPRADESVKAVEEKEAPPYQSFGEWTKERSRFYATSRPRSGSSGSWSSTGDSTDAAPLLGTPAWQAKVVGVQATAAAAASSSSSSAAAPDLSAEKTVFDSEEGKPADQKLPKPPEKGANKGGPVVAVSPHVVSPPSPSRPLALSPAGGFPNISTALDEILNATMMFYENM